MAGLYSETMKKLSELSEDDFELYKMRWGFVDYDQALVDRVGREAYAMIPACTPVRRNAMTQILASFENSSERKVWADRIEGKVTQTTVNVNHETSDKVGDLKTYTQEYLDDLFAKKGL